VPLVADIHFDYRLALQCAEGGADKIRINPGNIGGDDRVRAVADICRERKIPIRIGVNSGSVSREILAKYGSPTPAALAESALEHAGLLEKNNFYNIIISVKASNVYDTVAANRILAGKCQYPLHIGVTEAGTAHMGALKSAAGMGALLCDGIGDTVRVSLTALPESEVTEGIAILKAVGVRKSGLNIISCPTCGRTRIGLIGLVEDFERRAASEMKAGAPPLTVALMGCAVNGPGEAREADFGIAGGAGDAVLFRRGKIIRKIGEGDIVQALIDEINGSF
jgi:(E)-4-hydroxy-3-methylbut-2-enyl-diphosphate synthase